MNLFVLLLLLAIVKCWATKQYCWYSAHRSVNAFCLFLFCIHCIILKSLPLLNPVSYCQHNCHNPHAQPVFVNGISGPLSKYSVPKPVIQPATIPPGSGMLDPYQQSQQQASYPTDYITQPRYAKSFLHLYFFGKSSLLVIAFYLSVCFWGSGFEWLGIFK